MKIQLKTADPAGLASQALLVFLFTDDTPALTKRPELAGLKDYISPRLRKRDFTAKHLNVMTLFPEVKGGPERIVLVGLGAAKEFSPAKLRAAAAKGVQTVQELRRWEACLLLPPAPEKLLDPTILVEAAVLGAWLGQYSFAELKSKDEEAKKPLQHLTVLIPEGAPAKAMAESLQAAEVTARAIATARDLVNRPANLIYPETLAEAAGQLARENKLKIKVMDVAAAKKKGLGAFLGVAQGSAHPGRVIILEYRGAGAGKKPVALVGKAITFDSGGLCLKSPESMGTMKTDMAGGAAVLSIVAAAAQLRLKVNLVGVVPAAENMPGGQALRPGDVLKSLSGQTVEVVNTDAEGRLILADALTLATEYKPSHIIDLATLTGACVVALGEKCAGLMGTDQELIEALKRSSQATGEIVWQLPLLEEYFEGLKSEVADLKHTATRYGGSITAALFLKQFVGDIPWAHLDIAGTARAEKGGPDTPQGGTGFGVHLLLHYLRNLK
jgi:leucyl aminopeptidase